MRRVLTSVAKRALFATGHYTRALAARRFPGIAVLGYHGVLRTGTARASIPFAPLHVSEAHLDAHCALIAATCEPLTLAAAEAAWRGDTRLPARGVLVTFDDGHRSVLELALPILRAHGVPAVVFACTDPIARQRSFWFDAVARALSEEAVESAKALAWDGWRALADAHDTAPPRGDPLAPLSPDDLMTLARDPLITLAPHTATHPILARAPRDVQRDEIMRSMAAVEQVTGVRPTAFAYPNGRPGMDYDMTTLALLREAGVETAFTTAAGFAARGAPLERPRFLMLDSVDGPELAHRLAHSWS